MEDRGEKWFYLSGGPLAAVVLGMALVPLRGATTASNWTFVFLVLTIVVAELGGRGAAVATALCSALSLDFFLTEPYLKLSIADKHDLIAFVGLMVCGLSVAALGSTRARHISHLKVLQKHLELLNSAVGELAGPGPVATQLTSILNGARAVLPLTDVAVRDGDGRIVAKSAGSPAKSVPDLILQPDLLLPVMPRGVAFGEPICLSSCCRVCTELKASG
jgi:K+-sensing histidine kinase KdpD